jgi:hypothetical protein
MKSPKTLTELAVEIERQAQSKRDYVASSQAITMHDDGKTVGVEGVGEFGLTNHARGQLAAKLDIPLAYFGRLEEKHPALLAHNVNELMRREPSRGMVRTLDGRIRGFMSDRYRPLDNYDLADAVLPLVLQLQRERGLEVVSCEITETKLYLKFLMPWLDRELPVPQGLKMGEGHNWFIRKVLGAVTISNSEVGAGMLALSPGVFEKQCTNLAVYRDEGFGRMHVGKRAADDGDNVARYLTDETRRLDDAAVFAKLRDVFMATMDGRVMDVLVDKMLVARGDPITGDPGKVVEAFAKRNQLSQEERGGLLRHLTNSGEMTRYGLQWAVTRLSQDVNDYDRASELERMGGQVIELPRSDWQQLLKAA